MGKLKKTIEETRQTNSIPNDPWGFFWFVSGQHKKVAIAAILTVVAASALSVSLTYLLKLIVDAIETGDMQSVIFWGLMSPVAVLMTQLLFRLSGYFGAHWTNYSIKTANDTLLDYLLKHSHNYYINRFAGSISTKVGNVHNAFSEIIPDFLWSLLTSLISFVVTFIFIFQVNSLAAFSFILLLLLLVVINRKFAPTNAKLSKANAAASTNLKGNVVDVFSNISVVRQYVQDSYELTSFKKLTTNKRDRGLRSWLFGEKVLVLNSFVLLLATICILWLVVNEWQQGGATTGDLVLVISLIFNITGNLLFVGRAYNAISRTAGEMREGLEDILLPHEIVDVPDAKKLKVKSGEIVLDKVNFSFDANAVFSDFSLKIPAEQRIGLVGSSGAGKTTFVSLLLRQHELLSGQILFDGQNISQVTQDSLRKAVALVPQEPSLFHRTIRDNIAYAKPRASLKEVIAVAKKAQAHKFISQLPEGYDTLVGEKGIKLSGGQKQRIAIARAMLKNAPILILDEATSALDSESEYEIQKALHVLMAGKTVIAIAHRLSTLREMDRIIVLENGKITEDGDHETLLAYGGQYASLWKHQAGGFIVG